MTPLAHDVKSAAQLLLGHHLEFVIRELALRFTHIKNADAGVRIGAVCGLLGSASAWRAFTLGHVTERKEEARAELKRAHALHAERRIDAAIAAARRAIELDPGMVDGWTYLGTTLVTRQLAFEEGLQALEHAAALAPNDPGVHYSLGWCYEFVAYRLEKQSVRPYRDPVELYELAASHLQRCIALQPEKGLREDAEDLLAAIESRLS